MTMAKKSSRIFTLAAVACMALAGCNKTISTATSTATSTGGSTSTATSTSTAAPLDDVQKAIQAAEGMTKQQLYKKAMEELGSNTMSCIGNSSRGATAKEYFLAYLQGKKATQVVDPSDSTKKIWQYTADDTIRAEFPDYNENFAGKIDWTQPKNNSIFDQITGDIKGSTHVLSMTLIQDASQIQSRMLNNNYLYNYIPKEWGGDKAENGEPFALQSLNKIFEFNNLTPTGGTAPSFTNMWDFVKDGNAPKFMGISAEPVGRNFLVMLTEDKYATQMKAAFDALPAGDEKTAFQKTIDEVDSYGIADTYGITGENAKYSLAWIKRWVAQYSQDTDDGPICNTMVKTTSAGMSGLLVYSKLRSVTETAEASRNNVTVAAYQDGYTGLGGFMYKHYLQVIKTCPYPYTACAFINFMTTSKDGFSAWGKDIGGYPSDSAIAVDHTTDGDASKNKDKDGNAMAVPALNDKGYDWWKAKCVVEDPIYTSDHALLITWMDTLRK